MIPRIEIQGKVFRDIDRMMGRIPALDQALRKRLPAALTEVGEVMVRRARAEAPFLTGRIKGETKYQMRGETLAFGVWGVPYAYPIEFGVNSRAIINEHERRQSILFGEKVEPFDVTVRQHVRDRKIKSRQYLHPSYYASFKAMFGIFNRVIEECKQEVGLGGD